MKNDSFDKLYCAMRFITYLYEQHLIDYKTYQEICKKNNK